MITAGEKCLFPSAPYQIQSKIKQSCYFGPVWYVVKSVGMMISAAHHLCLCAVERPSPPTHWSGPLNAMEVAEKSLDWHMAATLTARLQITLIAFLAFHRLKAYRKRVKGAINAAAAVYLQSLLCPPVSNHHILRYTSNIQKAGMTSATHWFFMPSKPIIDWSSSQ